MKPYRRTILSLLTTAVAVCTMASAHAVEKSEAAAKLLPAAIRDAGVLRIAVPDVGKPLAYKEGTELKGLDVDLAQALGDVLGLKAEINLIPFSAALTGLQANKYDISFGEFYVTTERLKVVDFVTNWQDYSSFLVTKSSGYKPTKLSDICGRNIGAMAGSAEFEILKKAADDCAGNEPQASAFPSINNAILALNSNRVDGVLINRGGAQESIRMDTELDASGEIGGGPTATAVARSAHSNMLLAAIKAGYDALIQNGEYRKILDKNDVAYGAVKEAIIYVEGSTLPSYSF